MSTRTAELGHGPVSAAEPEIAFLDASELRHPPENDRLYKPIDPDAPDIAALAESIATNGILEPLVVTLDGYVLSGNRRLTAARRAGLRCVPCRVEPFGREDDPDRFLTLLREHNRQREKTFAEKMREEILSADPDDSYATLTAYRESRAAVKAESIKIRGETTRCEISAAKLPLLIAIQRVVNAKKKFWPLSDRAIHYALLNNPPLKHASKPDSVYRNDAASYKAAVELLTRARLTGAVPMSAIHDPTRPVTSWRVASSATAFIREQIGDFMQGYARDLMQSQPNHVEILCEKNTIEPIIRAVASDYCIPLTSGRGYCSIPPRAAMAERYVESGKEKLVLLVVSDFDPEGEDIAHSLVRSLRDDFSVENVHGIKVALTAEQVATYKLVPMMKVKTGSSRAKAFVTAHGNDVFELEALEPEELQNILRRAIDAVIDIDLFNAEVAAERDDAAHLAGVRKTVIDALKDCDIGDEEADG